jgi:hypothetical protein
MPVMHLDLKRNNLHTWFIFCIILLFILNLVYSLASKPTKTSNKKDILVLVISKNRETKKTEPVVKFRRGGLYNSQSTIYDYWKITTKDDKTYSIPKENESLYNKVELNKPCFVTVNTDVTPNVILDVKYCN